MNKWCETEKKRIYDEFNGKKTKLKFLLIIILSIFIGAVIFSAGLYLSARFRKNIDNSFNLCLICSVISMILSVIVGLKISGNNIFTASKIVFDMNNKLKAVLNDDEKKAQFDKELSSEPLYSLDYENNGNPAHLIITKHFFIKSDTSFLILYNSSIIKIKETASHKTKKKRKLDFYNLNFYNEKNKIIGVFTTANPSLFNTVKEASKKYVLNI